MFCYMVFSFSRWSDWKEIKFQTFHYLLYYRQWLAFKRKQLKLRFWGSQPGVCFYMKHFIILNTAFQRYCAFNYQSHPHSKNSASLSLTRNFIPNCPLNFRG